MKSENSFTAFCLISTLLRRVSSARHLVNLDKMKIFAVGMNYLEHNKELHGSLFKPEEPVIFTKADSAVLKDHKPFFIPDHMGRIDYETEIVVRISKLGKNISERFAHRYYDAVTVGIDFTARELQKKLRSEGKPWDLCKGFDGSAALGRRSTTTDKFLLYPIDLTEVSKVLELTKTDWQNPGW